MGSNGTKIKAQPPMGLRAGLKTDIINPKFMGFLYFITDNVLKQQGGGSVMAYRLYDELEQDAHAGAVIGKRKMAVIAQPWGVTPASTSKRDMKIAKEVFQQLTDLGFDRLCFELLDALLKGFAVQEIMWAVEKDRVVAKRCFQRDQRRFQFSEDQETGDPVLKLRNWENAFPGDDVPENKFIVHTVGAKDGNPFGIGLGQRVYWPVWFKKQIMSYWLVYLEKYAVPTAMAEYDPNMDKTKQDELLNVLNGIAQDASIIVPKGTLVTLLEPQRQGSMSPFERGVRWLDEQISEAVLGETLTTNAGRTGSHAAAQVHNGVRMELVQFDSDLLNATIQRMLVKPIVDFNFPGAEYPQIFRKEDQADAMEQQSKTDVNLAQLGFYPNEERVQKVYGDGYVKEMPLILGVQSGGEPSQVSNPNAQKKAPIPGGNKLDQSTPTHHGSTGLGKSNADKGPMISKGAP